MPQIQFAPLINPTDEIVAAISRWENDPILKPLSRPNQTAEDLEKHQPVTLAELVRRLTYQQIYLISLDEQLVGEMSYRIDPAYLFRQEPGTAWIGITIGEAQARGKGIGRQALQYLEQQIALNGARRIELGVFEFNTLAHSLYQRMGYQEIGRISDFTYWQGRMWQDIRMEKYLER
jgi:RimJ/RimL family protein N-acetyltransferase